MASEESPDMTDRNAKRSTGPPVLEVGDDWDKFRRRFEAYGERNGLQPALERAEVIMSKKEMKVRLRSAAKERNRRRTKRRKRTTDSSRRTDKKV